MSTEQVVYIVVAITIAAVALLGALFAARALGRAGAGLRVADERLTQLAANVPGRMEQTRMQLSNVDAQAERALWTLGNLDTRMDSATADLVAKRVASDTLRLRLIDGRLTIARIRQLVHLMVRLGQLRRDFL